MTVPLPGPCQCASGYLMLSTPMWKCPLSHRGKGVVPQQSTLQTYPSLSARTYRTQKLCSCIERRSGEYFWHVRTGAPPGYPQCNAAHTQRQRRGHLLRSVRCISLPAGVQPSGAAFSHAAILSLSPRARQKEEGGPEAPLPH